MAKKDLRPLLLSAALLGACSGSALIGEVGGGGTPDDDDAATDDDDAASNDADNDGDPDDTDCDDEDPTVASTLDEVCGDGKDNDCDPDTRCFAVRGDEERFVEPIEGGEDVLDWYGYGDTAGGTHGLDLHDTLVLALYRDPGADMWLVLIVDAVSDGSGGGMSLDISNLGDADHELSDDPGEGVWVEDEIWFDFRWADCCTDGGIVGPLDDDFCVEVNVLSGAEGLGNGIVTYDGGEPVEIGRAQGRVSLCVED